MKMSSVARVANACSFVVLLAATSVAQPEETIVDPAESANEYTPNDSVKTTADDLFTTKTYDIILQLKLTSTSPWANVGSTETFSGNTYHTENVDVDAEPGPGEYPGRAVLRSFNMGQPTEIETHECEWVSAQ
jgi:hypothetical protein